jgi:hypothetical protein
MSAQLAAYLVLSITLYYASQAFKFINTSPLNEHAFVLKQQSILEQLEAKTTNIMYSSIINKYLNWPKYFVIHYFYQNLYLITK